jgi:hypothetical protein
MAPPSPPDASPRKAAAPPRVHAYPPHAIRADGVGPYLLGEQMRQVLRDLPEGPHLELLQVGKVAEWRLARAEGGALVVGADASNEVTFVSVLAPEVAKTSSGVGVGATGAQLIAALGSVRERPGIRDRRIFEMASLPGVHFLTDAPIDAPADVARVVGVSVVRGDAREPAEAEASPCAAPAVPRADVLAAARARAATPGATAEPMVRWGCVTNAAPEAVVIAGGELIIVGGEPGKLRRLGALAVGPVDFAGTIDVDGDRRDEIVFGAQHRGESEHSVELHVLRWEGGRLVELLAERPYVIGEAVAAAAGVKPAEVDLAIEVRASRGTLVVGGFFLARRGDKLHELAPLLPVTLRLESRRPGAAADAGSDARRADGGS